MKTGFYFVLGRRDYFVPTTRQNKTLAFSKQIVKALGHEPTEGNAMYIRDNMSPATYEEVETENGFRYERITGKYFTICNPEPDHRTNILIIH